LLVGKRNDDKVYKQLKRKMWDQFGARVGRDYRGNAVLSNDGPYAACLMGG